MGEETVLKKQPPVRKMADDLTNVLVKTTAPIMVTMDMVPRKENVFASRNSVNPVNIGLKKEDMTLTSEEQTRLTPEQRNIQVSKQKKEEITLGMTAVGASKEDIEKVRNAKTAGEVEDVLKSNRKYSDLLRAFTDWVKLNYEKRLQDETARIIRPPARLPRVTAPPDIVSRTSKAAEAENKEAGKVAKDYSVLRKTPGQGYGFEPGFGPAGSSFAVPSQ